MMGSMKGMMAAVLLLAACAASADTIDNDTFGTSEILVPGVMSVSGSLAGISEESGWPDLTMGYFDADGLLIDYNDDGSHLGDGYASGLYEYDINANGVVYLSVSGYDDFDFDGFGDESEGDPWPHEYSGDFTLYVDTYDETGGLVDELSFASLLCEGQTTDFEIQTSASAVLFDAYLDNTPCDWDPTGLDFIDFVTFTGLTPGDALVAEITDADFDTMLGLYDEAGALIGYDDDGGVSLLSALEVTVPASGELTFGVAGYDYYGGGGIHGESGDYTLELLPEPASLALLALGAPALIARRRRAA